MKTKPAATPDDLPEQIRVETLSTVSGFSKSRLRQLADEGKLPAVVGARLPTIPALKSLFAYLGRDTEELQREKLKLLAAERRIKEREDRVAEKLEQENYIRVEDAERCVQIWISAIERIPNVLESETGCGPAVGKRCQQLLDEARHEMSRLMRKIE